MPVSTAMRKNVERRRDSDKEQSRTSMANLVEKRGSRASINEKQAKKDKSAGMSQTTLSKGIQPNPTSPTRKRGVASKIEIEPTSPTRKRGVASKIEIEPTSPTRKRGVASKIEIEPTSPTRRNKIASHIDIEDECNMKNWKNVINDEKKATNQPGFQVYSVQGTAELRSIKDINVADLEIENVISQDKSSRQKFKEKSR
jgi:hypothetical protein